MFTALNEVYYTPSASVCQPPKRNFPFFFAHSKKGQKRAALQTAEGETENADPEGRQTEKSYEPGALPGGNRHACSRNRKMQAASAGRPTKDLPPALDKQKGI